MIDHFLWSEVEIYLFALQKMIYIKQRKIMLSMIPFYSLYDIPKHVINLQKTYHLNISFSRMIDSHGVFDRLILAETPRRIQKMFGMIKDDRSLCDVIISHLKTYLMITINSWHKCSIKESLFCSICELFKELCDLKNVMVIDSVCDHFKPSVEEIRTRNSDILRHCSETNNIKIVRYLFERYGTGSLVNEFDIIPISGTKILEKCCESGYLDLLKYYVEIPLVHTFLSGNDHLNYFAIAYENGHLNVVKYLMSIKCVAVGQIRSVGNYLIKSSRHIEMVKFLIETFGLDINDIETSDDSLFKSSCDEECVDLVKYLVKIYQKERRNNMVSVSMVVYHLTKLMHKKYDAELDKVLMEFVMILSKMSIKS